MTPYFSDSANEWSKFVQIVIGCIGLIANTVGIPLFLKIGNIFNQSLAFLAVVDNVSIVSTITQYILVKTETRTNDGPFDSRQGTLLILFGILQLKSFYA